MRGKHPLERLFVPRRLDDGVTQADEERLSRNEVLCLRDRVREAPWRALSRVVQTRPAGHVARLSRVVKVEPVAVEVVLDRSLLLAGNDQNLRDSSRHDLLDDVLNHRLPTYGQHLLRLRLRSRQQPRADARSWDDSARYARDGSRQFTPFSRSARGGRAASSNTSATVFASHPRSRQNVRSRI